MIDRTNTDPKYWEKILHDQKLSEKQLDLQDFITERIFEEGKPVTKPRRKEDGRNKDLIQLRHIVDKDDRFFESHQINKIRTREKENEIPAWAIDNKETQKLLLQTFPKWKTNSTQRKRAGRWAAIIIFFYRMNMTKSQIAEELGSKTKTINVVLQRIHRAAKGRRGDNRAPLGVRPVGRPKKSTIPSAPPL